MSEYNCAAMKTFQWMCEMLFSYFGLDDWNYFPMSQGAKLNNANLKGANLQRAYMRHVDLRDTVCK